MSNDRVISRPTLNPDIDFLALQPQEAQDEVRQLKEAVNVLSSYSHAIDTLAEALQNATDAVDTRLEREPDAPAHIRIEFDVPARRFSVVDTGIGMSKEDVGVVLTPNITLKAGRRAHSRVGRSRGEKGVGLSFLAFASDSLSIRTSNGRERQDVSVRGAHDWVVSQGKTARPLGRHTSLPADELLGSTRYTSITLHDIARDEFDDDLFEYGRDELIWLLRTRTAIGNTTSLFGASKGPARGKDITVDLTYVDQTGTELEPVLIRYAYATPEELLPPDKLVISHKQLADLAPSELVEAVRGAAVRYSRRWTTPSGHVVAVYALVIDGDEMLLFKRDRLAHRQFFPDEWQGIFVATRGMPTGVSLLVSAIQPRSYLRRMFVLVQDDDLVLDLGRKTLHGRTRKMLADVVERAWKADLHRIVPRVTRDVRTAKVDGAALAAVIARAHARNDLNGLVPYMKEPITELEVIGVFHELVASARSVVPAYRTLTTGVFGLTDSVAYSPDRTEEPLYVVFGLRGSDLTNKLEQENTSGAPDIGVVWDIGPRDLARRGISVMEVDDVARGTTHELHYAGIGGVDKLPVIALQTLFARRRTDREGSGV